MQRAPYPSIAIAGAGSVGRILAFNLVAAGAHVRLLARTESTAKTIRENGLPVRSKGTTCSLAPDKVSTASKDTIDSDTSAVFICVKCPDTASAAESVSKNITSSTPVILVQNGAGAYKEAANYIPRNQLFCGIASFGACMLDDGVTEQHGDPALTIAPCPGTSNNRPYILRNLQGVSITFDSRSLAVIWSKLCLNCGVNPVTAIYGIKNGDLLNHQEAWELALRSAEEAYRTAEALGIDILYDDIERELRLLCRRTQNNTSSMLQDIRQGRQTEIEYMNGFIIRQAEAGAVQTPCNRSLYEKIINLRSENKANGRL